MNIIKIRLIFVLIFYQIICVFGGAIQITNDNIDLILSSNEIVFLNFYANWCRFSQILNPIYDQLAEKVSKEYSKKNLIVIGKVDSDAYPSISTKYNVNKYPTLKLFRNGLMNKREYRGARQVDSFFDYLRKEIESSIIEISSIDEFSSLDLKRKSIIGYFNDRNSSNYQIFFKVGNLLRDNCQFIQLINKNENELIYSRSLNNEKRNYSQILNNEESFYLWSNSECISLIREITFENAEELTDEGLPFLILFHHPNDKQIISLFEKQVEKELLHQTSQINCLHGDGSKFVHPLKHLGKTINDLPLLVIDSFKHMFLFPDIKQISESGKLFEFVKDFHSGKLPKYFHRSNEISSPRESVFIRLTPSRQRYSFRDEL